MIEYQALVYVKYAEEWNELQDSTRFNDIIHSTDVTSDEILKLNEILSGSKCKMQNEICEGYKVQTMQQPTL